MNSNHRTQAEKIYSQVHPTDAYIAMMGTASLRPIQRATVAEIEAHLVMVAEVASEYDVALYADKIEFGSTREQVIEIAERKSAKRRRSAGYRALKAKYGEDSAKRIISRANSR